MLEHFRYKRRTRERGFSAVEIMVTMAIIGVLYAMIVPGVVNTRRMTKRRLDYIQYRDYLRATAFSFQETLHLEQPLLVSLDFTGTDINYDDVKDMMGEMFYSSMMNGFPYPEMRYLGALDFTDTKYDDRWTEWIVPAPALTNLILNNTVITDATIDQLGGLSKGTFIYGRPHPLTKLRQLTVVNCTNVSDAALGRLKAVLPKLTIVTNVVDYATNKTKAWPGSPP